MSFSEMTSPGAENSREPWGSAVSGRTLHCGRGASAEPLRLNGLNLLGGNAALEVLLERLEAGTI